MKGIILAGGSGTRLYPLTLSVSKQMLPVYDKPMIYYPLSTLLLAGIKDILIIATPQHMAGFEQLLGDGNQLGISLSYKVQEEPRGLAEAYILAEDFLSGDSSMLILGDNIFHAANLQGVLRKAVAENVGATVFAYPVDDPGSFGIIEFDALGRAVSIEEKPAEPKSRYAIPGLYICDAHAPEIAAQVKPSARGELEITSVLQAYLDQDRLSVVPFGRGTIWLDTGSYANLLDAANFVQLIQKRSGSMVSAIEEVAYNESYINAEQLRRLAEPLIKTSYGDYLLKLVAADRQEANMGA
ncbi:MAG: glucose-1-phosphate thymidylyltransferase RfbA [Coriobacteriales bacterium]|nr:glucose-1-phosphate thymidylyltransferase RfbA [Coriobacteriales bacterium]